MILFILQVRNKKMLHIQQVLAYRTVITRFADQERDVCHIQGKDLQISENSLDMKEDLNRLTNAITGLGFSVFPHNSHFKFFHASRFKNGLEVEKFSSLGNPAHHSIGLALRV